jgi:hypothetical protein
MRRTILIACWSVLLLALPARAENTEHLAIDRKEIKVWTVEVPGQPMRGFRAVTTVRSSLGGLVALLMDAEAAPRWVYRMEQMRLVGVDARAGIFVVYAEMDFWPLRNRDTVVTGRIAQDPQSLAVTLESRNIELEALPPVAGKLRMPAMWGRWDFRPLGNGLVEVTMSGQADPGGSIPAFLVNLMIEDTPYKTLQGLRRVIGESRYQQARIEGIREPR